MRRQARELKDAGAQITEIARALGIKRGSVHHLLGYAYDPVRAAAWVERYRRPCPRCGKLMHGHHGVGNPSAPGLCQRCAAVRRTAGGIEWTTESLVAKLQEFARVVGRPPSASDFTPHRSKRPDLYLKRMERKRALGLPSASIIIRRFGGWNNAMKAAGFPPRPSSRDVYS